MCEACKELSKVYDKSQNLLVSHFKSQKTGNHIFVLVQDGENGASSVSIEVNYCPWCGRKLSGDNV